MEANELMIGNWVYRPDCYDVVKEIRANGIIGSDSLRGLISFKEIKPIPLTAEILEKNGFYYGYTSNEEDLASSTIAQLSEEDKGWVWDEGAGSVKVIFPNESDGGEIQICDQSFDRSMRFFFAENIMLHELQNAMRLCKIEKEIEL